MPSLDNHGTILELCSQGEPILKVGERCIGVEFGNKKNFISSRRVRNDTSEDVVDISKNIVDFLNSPYKKPEPKSPRKIELVVAAERKDPPYKVFCTLENLKIAMFGKYRAVMGPSVNTFVLDPC